MFPPSAKDSLDSAEAFLSVTDSDEWSDDDAADDDADSMPSLATDSDDRPDSPRPSAPDSTSGTLRNVNVSPTALERLRLMRSVPTSESHIAELVRAQMNEDMHMFSRPRPLIPRRKRIRRPREKDSYSFKLPWHRRRR